MQNQSKDHEAIASLLTRLYFEILEIEKKFSLTIGGGDMRERIEYFHDAIRCFISEDYNNTRLNVEMLSYDLRCLRYIQSNPLSTFKDDDPSLSPSSDIMTNNINIDIKTDRPDRETKNQISSLYKNYAIMFSALLKPIADKNHKDRLDDLDNDIGDIKQIIDQLEQQKDININMIIKIAQNLSEANLRIIIVKFIQEKRYKNINELKKLISHLKNIIEQKERNIKKIEDNHLAFASSQLIIFESSKDLLKELASRGMNIVGKFVEASIADTKRQMGR
ncbi:MAG: hypothetical protein R3D71_11250 [Rickettsiales bacterium]